MSDALAQALSRKVDQVVAAGDVLGLPVIQPTAEQLALIDAGCNRQESIMVNALAGCAKSTSLQMLMAKMPPQPTLAVAFNLKTKKELERLMPSHVAVKTLNGLGHSAWAKAIGKALTLDDKKLGKIVTAVAKANEVPLLGDQWDTVRRLTSKAMTNGLVPSKYQYKGLLPDTPVVWQQLADDEYVETAPLLLDLARQCLIEDIDQGLKGIISFDDQIYLSSMFGGVFPRFPLVLVDESQDLSTLNHIQLAKSAAGRIISVGDVRQSIYSFRGADAASMAKIKGLRKDWIELPLATTFRCPKVVVARNREHAPGFTAFETNAEGQVLNFVRRQAEDGSPLDWHWSEVPGTAIAVLCRNNAPLLAMAFKLIRQQVGVIMLGRDIGKGLIALSKKIVPKDETPIVEVVAVVQKWADHECALAHANDKEEKVAGITDRAECLLAVCENAGVADAGALRRQLDTLFAREVGKVTLSSVHRAKGLEWPTVVHLDPWRVPSRHAKEALQRGNPVPMEQEMNIKYVAETRTKDILVLANLEDFS